MIEERSPNQNHLIRCLKRWWLAAALLTLLYLVALALNLFPALRGPAEWRWAYALPATVRRLWLPALLLGFYLGVVIWLEMGQRLQQGSRRTLFGVGLLAAVMTPLWQLSLLTMDHPDVLAPLFYRTVSSEAGGFYNVGVVVTDVGDFLAHFAERMPGYPVHPQRHPPGLPLLFALTRQLFDTWPKVAHTLSSQLRPYQCHNLTLMNLPDSAIAAAWLQMLVPFGLGLGVIPLYGLGKLLYNPTIAQRAMLFWPLLPSVALWATRWNQLYGVFILLAFFFFHKGLLQQRRPFFLFAGLVAGTALFFSFGNAVIVGFLGIYALLWLIANPAPTRPGWSWLLTGAMLFGLGLAILWLLAWWLADLSLITTWRTAMHTHLGLGRSYFVWLFYHPYDFFIFLGIPVTVLWLFSVRQMAQQWRRGQRELFILAFLVSFILLDLSGTSQGEVARVWAFLMPLALLIACRFLPDNTWLVAAFVGLLGLQTFVSNIFLRPVGTGLSDPPAGPPILAASTAPPLATWDEGIVLQEIRLPQTPVTDTHIPIQLTWSSTTTLSKAYTLFVHLLDAEGNLVAQYDGMPYQQQWPTTCWQPGTAFSDTYWVPRPAELTGPLQIRVGFYWLPTGERLSLQKPPTTDNAFVAGTVYLTR